MIAAVYAWAFLQSLFFGGNILLSRRGPSGVFLASFFICTSLHIGVRYWAKFGNMMEVAPMLLFVPDFCCLCYGPLLLLYIYCLFGKKNQKRSLLHFIPALLFLLYFFLFEILNHQNFQLKDYVGTLPHKIVLLLILVSNIIYLVVITRVIGIESRILDNKKSWFFIWLRVLVVFIFLKVLSAVLFFAFQSFLKDLFSLEDLIFARNTTDRLFLFFNAVIIIVSSYFSIVSFKFMEEFKVAKKSVFKIAEEEAKLHIQRLNDFFNRERPYLNPLLNEKTIAEAINIPSHHLSKVLNENLNMNFTDFVNRYRIEEAKLRLANDKSATMYAIALDSGFNSESVFYRHFKKVTGQTPASYRKSL